ncbi:MAG TPA: adenylate/guanylate cyclase domain-containing protein [Burkholderiales bacterium]|nr:adenylate/guanylate cyclase domain-containing protein [Burkholderiales bacterium]
MQTAINRTFICSVVFLDIVEYSRKPVAEQIFFKERLNTLLTEALASVAPNDRIILDTGDGAALSFLGDPEDALYVGLALREALLKPQPPGPELKIRLGINLGPVRLVKDINGQPNIIGDGINVAQRVMGFSEPGQVLVSRSFYEVVSCLSEGYGQLFRYEGARTDKHVREHEIYTVLATTASLKRTTAAIPRTRLPAGGAVVLDKLTQTAVVVSDNLRRKPRLGTGLAVAAILSVAVGLRLARQPAAAPVPPPSSPPQRAAAAPAPAPARAASSAKPNMSGTPAAAPAKPAPPPSRASAAPAKPKPATRAARTPPAALADEEPLAEPETVATAPASATLNLAISPWGEVHIDGRLRGVAPPLRDIELTPGRHRVEIRNASFPPHVEIVDAKAGGRIRIRHKFQN